MVHKIAQAIFALALLQSVYSDGELNSGIYGIKWRNQNEHVNFEFTAKLSSTQNVWAAFSFSTDQQMGNDDATICKVYGDNALIEHAFVPENRGRPIAFDDANLASGFDNVTVKLDNNMLTCSYSRRLKINSLTRSADLSASSFFILTAHGKLTSSGDLIKHDEKSFSENKNNFGLATPNVEISPAPDAAYEVYSNERFSLKWKSHPERTDFVFTTSLENSADVWTAFAFSNDESMGDDDVSVCRTFNNVNSIEHMYVKHGAKRPYPLSQNDLSVGFDNAAVEYINGKLTCSFSRANKMPKVSNYFDLSMSYYLLFASGSLNSSNIMVYHGPMTRLSSEEKINFLGLKAVQAQVEPVMPSSYKVGSYEISWTDNAASTDFTFKTQLSSNTDVWTAFALSKDSSMGDDDVCVCKLSQTNSVEHLHSEGKSAPLPIDPANLLIGYSNVKIQFDNGVLTCSFTRAKTGANPDKYFDLNENFYILTATGSLDSNGNMQKHSNQISSRSLINFQISAQITSKDMDVFRKLHASLMIVAWLLLSSTGILFARYYKFIFPKTLISKLQFWFVMHRSIMMSVPLLSLVGFLSIWIKKQWTWVQIGSTANFVHSIVGILAIGFAFIQPLMALFRPDKDDLNRPVFNWAHRCLGILTYILSIVAIYFGNSIYFADASYSLVVLIVWTVWIVCLPLLLEISDHFIRTYKKKTIPVNSEANPKPVFMLESQQEPESEIQTKVDFHEKSKLMLMVIHLGVSILMSVAFIYLIITN